MSSGVLHTLPRLSRAPRSRRPGELALPPGYSMRALADPHSREAVEAWLRASPDHTVYHLGPYIDFLRAAGAPADVFLISREGNPLFALPVHSRSREGWDSGYSGVVFPATDSERVLRRSVAALTEVFSMNRHILFRMCQSAQARSYEDPGRIALLQRQLEEEGVTLDSIYGRLSNLDHLPNPGEAPTRPGRHPGGKIIDVDYLIGDSLRAYDPDTRNQIRQALRNGLTIEYVQDPSPQARAGAYARFHALHEESWRRTGLLPKPADHWPKLSDAIRGGGGEDLIVLVSDREGNPLAGVVCHAYQARALYWSGCSSVRGLRSRANPLCLHGAILAAREHGVSAFELGRFRARESSEKERAVTDYKAQFGGHLTRITSFASSPTVLTRARAAQAAAVFEARRRLAVALGRARASHG